jgi:hypothetical protein
MKAVYITAGKSVMVLMSSIEATVTPHAPADYYYPLLKPTV